MNYKKAIEQITERRKNDLLQNEQQVISAMRQNEQLHQTDVQIRKLQQDKRKGLPVDDTALAGLKQQRTTILKQMGISETVPYSCEKCRDTGICGDKPCACVIATVSATETTDATFESCDLSVFDKADRAKAQKVYDTMLMFCDKFPHTNIKNIMLLGGTGTGKTHLAACVADRLTKSGFGAMFVSAFGFVNRMLNYHTAPVGEKLDYLLPLLDCDLLIIDDLGTESILKNVTIEYLYSVFNERMRQKKHTMITTNLDKEMLMQRYGERLASRFFDMRTSAGFVLAEKDIRRL